MKRGNAFLFCLIFLSAMAALYFLPGSKHNPSSHNVPQVIPSKNKSLANGAPTIAPVNTPVGKSKSALTEMQTARIALDRKDYETAVKNFRRAAEQGNAEAQLELGARYETGQGVPKDYTEALKWYRMAAEQGSAKAQNFLGVTYYRGECGVPRDYGEAVKWYQKAAEQGFAWGQFNLGWAYEKGEGVPQDFGEAVKWYRKAAEQEVADAQNNLGYYYFKGLGVAQDYGEAAKWYKKAAKQGSTVAQKNLDDMIRRGYVQEQVGERIEGAFGLRLGGTFDPAWAIHKGTYRSAPTYQFAPETSFRSFNAYFVMITPITHQIHTIKAIGPVASNAAGQQEQAVIMSFLEDKYWQGKVRTVGAADSFMVGFMEGINSGMGIKMIDQGDRYVTVHVDTLSDFPRDSISIEYCDRTLSKLAEEERIKLEAQEVDASGL